MAPTLKGIRFGRRKSQGNVLEEIGQSATPGTGFRVIPREDALRKSTGNALDLRKAATFQPQRQSSYEDDSSSSNRQVLMFEGRAFKASASSVSTGARFDQSGTRYSSTSTLQSPVEAMKKDRSPSPHFLKLGDDFESDWGDLFSGTGMDKRKSGLPDNNKPMSKHPAAVRSDSEPILSNLPKAFSHTNRISDASPPLNYAQRKDMTASPPAQWERRNSKDRLMGSPELCGPESPTESAPPPPPKHSTPSRDAKPYNYVQLDEPDYLEEPPKLGHSQSIRSQHSFTRSGADEDADAAMVRQSVRAVRASTLLGRSDAFESSPLARKEMNLAPPASRPLNNSSVPSSETTSTSSSNVYGRDHSTSSSRGVSPDKNDSFSSTPKAVQSAPTDEEEDTTMFDPEMMQAIQQANNRSMLGLPSESPKASPVRPNGARVMSMAEFNKQRNNKNAAPIQKDDSDSDDNYDDEDDDPTIQAQKRRVEQAKEAQHAVWRQRMKKAIGDQSSMPTRPEYLRTNQSAPSLMFNGEPQQDDDEDDDVPLAILQAHNFPSKGKNPDPRMSSASYVGVQDRPNSPARGNQRASQLPVFARRLPEDPYMSSADLSTPANRESLAFTKPRSQSVYGGPAGPPPGSSPVPGLPPGGLVGVIAEEERQRGFRRGSPNGQAGNMGFNMPGVGSMGSQMMPMMPMGPQSPAAQNDAVRNQQMLELMQQNSFMMKEMMEMRAQMQMFQMGGGPQGMPMPGLPGPGQSRPMSLAPGQDSSRRSVAPSTMYGRTMSFMGPAPNMQFMNQQAMGGGGGAKSVRNFSGASSMMGGLGNGLPNGYTPSIAPSERSNIGQPSRYKPVNFGDGGSTITAGSAAPGKKPGFLSAVMHSGKKSISRVKDDEDEEEWGATRRRR